MKTNLVVVMLAVLSSCAPTPPVAVAVDEREAAIRGIRAAEEGGIAAFGEGNAEKSASFYAPNAAVMLTNVKILEGPAIKETLVQMMADPNFSMKLTTVKVEAAKSGEVGYTRGVYTMKMTDPASKKVVSETGKYVTVYAKQADGSWKMVDDILNADAPATVVEAKK